MNAVAQISALRFQVSALPAGSPEWVRVNNQLIALLARSIRK